MHDAPLPVEILVVEDNPGDVELIRQGFSRGKLINTLHTVNNGDKALEFLYQRGSYQEAPRPGLILLDLNIPGTSGFELLEEIKSNAALKEIPVVVLTSSYERNDIHRAYQNYANSFLTKPVDFQEFINLIHDLTGYWLSLVKLPPGD